MSVDTLILIVAVNDFTRQPMYAIPTWHPTAKLIAKTDLCFIGSSEHLFTNEVVNLVADLVNISRCIMTDDYLLQNCEHTYLTKYLIEPDTKYDSPGSYKLIHCGEV